MATVSLRPEGGFQSNLKPGKGGRANWGPGPVPEGGIRIPGLCEGGLQGNKEAAQARPDAYQGDGLDWPATVGERTRWPVVIAGEAVDAITMPPEFARLVQAELEIMMLAGPVVTGPRTEPSMTPWTPWTFITQLANTRSPAVPADLLALGVRLVPAGSRVVAPPAPAREPAIWSAVVGAARRVAARRHAERPNPAPQAVAGDSDRGEDHGRAAAD